MDNTEKKKVDHIGIIADGNRRWAKKKHLPQKMGYAYGLSTIENLCNYSIANNIKYLSVFCLSTENLSRTKKELNNFFKLARLYAKNKTNWYCKNDIKIIFRGRREYFPSDIVCTMEQIEKATQFNKSLTLFIMVGYGGKQDIVDAIRNGAKTESEIDCYFNNIVPDPELIIRTGGHHRLSNFMLWQAAYTELYFIDTLFPDLDEKIMNSILQNYSNTKQNYGK